MRNCDKCGKELVPEFPDRMRRADDYPNYKGALVINISGGYNMLIDEYVPTLVLDEECGTQFFKDNPWAVTEASADIVEEGQSV